MTKRVIVSGLIGLAIFIVLAVLLMRPFSNGRTEEMDNFPGGLATGFVFLVATACSTFVSGALCVYLIFDEISYSREAINNAFYAGCITAIPLLALCVILAFSAVNTFPGCMMGTLGAVLMSVIGGSATFVTLQRLKARKTNS